MKDVNRQTPVMTKEAFMQKLMTALFAMVLALPMLAFAQSGMQDQTQDQQKAAQQQDNQASAINTTGQTTMPQHSMTGMVGDGGKSFTSDNKTYVVENPKKLAKYDNQSVSIELKFDTEKNTIRVLSVTPGQ